MKKYLFLLLAFLVSSTINAQQFVERANPKLSLQANALLISQKSKAQNAASKSLTAQASATDNGKISITLYCYNLAETQQALETMGFESRKITNTILTANITPDAMEEVANLSSVRKLGGLSRFYPTNKASRAASKVDACQAGTGLETPYTGKGVTIGIIDQGFLYTHPAFRITTDSVKIKAVWNLTNSAYSVYNTSKKILSMAEDYCASSHGTHVAGIAAGSNINGDATLCGMAPDADLVLVSSKGFITSDVLNGVSLIKEIAQKDNTPWVVNMSFGGSMNSHDGSGELSQIIDSLNNQGGIFVSAAGNGADQKTHAQHTFTSDRDSVYFLINPNGESAISTWICNSDSTDIDVDVFSYSPSTGKVTAISSSTWKHSGSSLSAFNNDITNRYEIYGELYLSSLISTSDYLVVALTGKSAHTAHMWLSENYAAEFTTSSKSNFFTDGDYTTNVNEPADGAGTIAVGSYVTTKSWTTLANNVINYTNCPDIGQLSNFSAQGPSTKDGLLKPDVSAPGQGINSSIKNNSTYDWTSSAVGETNFLTEKITYDGGTYYYGINQGTSMASPAVSGIVALWLQANPSLTRSQLTEIFLKTCTNTSGALQNGWNSSWGYGKIDAYEGLKLALKMGTTGINDIKNSTTPLTIQKNAGEWKLLFNNSESFANISLYDIDGRVVRTNKLQNVSRGQEEVVSFNGLSHGVYLLKVQTKNNMLSRKIMVE